MIFKHFIDFHKLAVSKRLNDYSVINPCAGAPRDRRQVIPSEGLVPVHWIYQTRSARRTVFLWTFRRSIHLLLAQRGQLQHSRVSSLRWHESKCVYLGLSSVWYWLCGVRRAAMCSSSETLTLTGAQPCMRLCWWSSSHLGMSQIRCICYNCIRV